MDVIFDAGVKNRYTLQVDGYGTIYFNKGTKVTQDKELIKKLINHPNYKRNDFTLVSNEEVVAQYLEGDTPDALTEEILDNVSRQGILELGEELQSRQSQPALIKIEIVGEPITDKVRQIIDYYKLDKNKEDVRKEMEQDEGEAEAEEAAEQLVETVTNTISTDMKAKEAIEYIENHDPEELEGFVTDEEDRVTVTRAFNEKMG